MKKPGHKPGHGPGRKPDRTRPHASVQPSMAVLAIPTIPTTPANPTIPPRRRGPKPKTSSPALAALHDIESKTSRPRSRISGKDRLFIRLFAESGFLDPGPPALAAGFKTPGAGWLLIKRLQPLIDAEQVRANAGKAMDLEEAMVLCAAGARDTSDGKTQLGFLTLQFRVMGALSDKPLPSTMRREFGRQINEIVDRIQTGLRTKGAKIRLKAMLGAAVSTEVSATGSVAVEIEQEDGDDGNDGSGNNDDLPAPGDQVRVIDVDASVSVPPALPDSEPDPRR